jgi:hypothetical protein
MSSQAKTDRRQLRVIAVGLMSLLAVACSIQWAAGQAGTNPYYVANYDPAYLKQDPATGEFKLDEKAVKAASTAKKAVVQGLVPYAENADKVKKYYKDYLYKSMTRPENLHSLPEKRKEIVGDLQDAKAKEMHDALLNDVFDMMKKFVTSSANLHPALRFNAMLIIGDLNAEEKQITLRFPNPLPAALDFMLVEYQKPTQQDGVKLAALLGILRHTQLDWARQDANKIPAATRQQITQLMLTLINTAEPPAGRKLDGHVWMQRRGVEILAALGLVGSNDAVTEAITGLLRNQKADLALRLSAAESLGKIKPPAKAKSLDPTKESLQLAALLVEACRKELDRMDAWQKKKMTAMGDMGSMGMGMGSGMGSGMMGMPSGMMGGADAGDIGIGIPGSDGASSSMGMMAGPKDPLVELYRRQLKYEVDCVKRGIGGISRLVPVTKDKKPPFDDLNKEINKVWLATDPVQSTIPGLQKSLKDSLKELEKQTASLLPKPKPEVVKEPESDVPADVPNAAAAVGAVGTGPGGATTVPGAATPAAKSPVTKAPGAAAPGAALVPAAGPGKGAPAAPAAPAAPSK